MDSILLKTINGISTERPPVWFMRQAGRLLPNYLKLKEKYTFWQLMKNPKLAAEVSLMPVRDLNVDAAILFSDILVIPYAMGMGLDFTDKGPVFEMPLKDVVQPHLKLKSEPEKLHYVYEVIDEIVSTKPSDIPLIGFCGAPLTVMCYMLQGLGTNSKFTDAERFFLSEKQTTKRIAEQVTELSIEYALQQIEHGVEVFQLFDTHAGLVPFEYYQEIFLPMILKIGNAVRKTKTPFIFFPKGIGTGLVDITEDVCDYVSIDWQTPISLARTLIDDSVGIQGNLDPRVLFADKETIKIEVDKLLHFSQTHKNFIFNLGHGFMPDTPFENAKYIVELIKNQ